MSDKALIGSVVERKTSASSNPPRHSAPYSGFPVAHHRSKSAFARSRERSSNRGSARLRVPPDVSSTIAQVPPAQSSGPDIWRQQVGEENKRRVEGMTEEEIKEEKRQIFERFGPEIGSILKRAKEARERAAKETATMLIPAPIDRDASAPPEISISRPPSRVRFAELQPQDVHVYQSAPPSPRRKPIALPPPPANDNSIVSLGLFTDKSSKPATSTTTDEAAEGTPEYIRQHYFPDAPADDPNLAWLKPPLEAGREQSSTLRFDLSGKPIPPEISSTLPTHLGLHHHADGYHAGYTLDDIFLLCRSSVSSQRATMLGVLIRIAKKVALMRYGAITGLEDFVGKEEELRKRMLAAGLEAVSARGSVGARAVELTWTCIVNWDEKLLDVLSVELQSESDHALSSIPLDQFLLQVAMVYEQADALPESLIQLLAILHRLAQQNNEVARTIVMTPKLISNLVKTHLLTPIPPQDPKSYPEPAVLELLIILVLASRSNAEGLIECADPLLRFVTYLPTESPFPLLLGVSLLTNTLRFYAALGTYGLYAHVSSTAMTHLMGLEQFIISPKCPYRKLCVAWADLLSVWMSCAVDPHRTTPPHEILWSQIVSFGWHAAILDLTHKLDVHEHDREAWGAIWRMETVWLTGCRVNAVKAGQEERTICSVRVKDGFANGKERHIMEVTLDGFRQRLIVLGTMSFDDEWRQSVKALNRHAGILAAAIDFWVSCTPLSGKLLSAPPFLLPFSKISDLCEQLVRHVLWQNAFNSGSYAYALVRPLSSLLIAYLGLSKRLPGTTQDLWMAQALSIITRLLPSHEEFALDILEELFQTLTVEWFQSKGYCKAPLLVDMNLLKPFLSYAIQPNRNIYVGPSPPTVKSIALATTQRLPSATRLREFGLPLKHDWPLSPLDHLLRSGSSDVFQALPASWKGSELQVVQATLLFTLATRDILANYGLSEFSLCREEAIFNCMKIFMLEHEQPQTDSSVEVFRNTTVTQLMDSLLEPFTFGIASGESSPDPNSGTKEDLESIASRFLGSSTPFFQYYTDFVALYDAISFAHPVFARLLLPPLSMRYALDYRKHFWDDFGHVVKTIRTRPDQVVTADIREYLFPPENSKPILWSYVRALINDTAQEFLQLIAVHHVACNIWTDLGEEGTAIDEDLSISLLKTIIEQGKAEIARKVVTYRQTRDGSLILPPSCYEESVAINEARLASLKQQRGGKLIERVESMNFKYSEWPPTISKSQLEELSIHATTYALAHGFLYLPPGSTQPPVPASAIHAPFTLLPSPFPRALFLEAKKLQRLFNVLYAQIAMDDEFLDTVMGAEHGVGRADDFVGQLWKGWKQLREEGIAQPLHLGIFRSDYLLHSTSENQCFLKQVEFNTISSSFGALSQRVSELHRYLFRLTNYYNLSPFLKFDSFPGNDTVSAIAEGLVAAHSAYGVPSARVLFVIQSHERNVFDQRLIEYHLFERHQIRVIRQSFEQLASTATVDSKSRCLHILQDIGQVEVSVVYYRTGYTASDYATSNDYATRIFLERSRAIKCPTIPLQLAGGKKVQQVLTQPGILERFLCDPKRGVVLAHNDIETLRNTFMEMWSLEVGAGGMAPDDEAGKAGGEHYGVRRAREEAHSLVLKPQREGGGNNVYKEDIHEFLEKLEPEQQQAWIAMRLITPPEGVGNYLVRATNEHQGPVKTEVISELGIYGWALFGNSGETLIEKESGWLLRTKGKETNEGGVATGFSVLDSVLLQALFVAVAAIMCATTHTLRQLSTSVYPFGTKYLHGMSSTARLPTSFRLNSGDKIPSIGLGTSRTSRSAQPF